MLKLACFRRSDNGQGAKKGRRQERGTVGVRREGVGVRREGVG